MEENSKIQDGVETLWISILKLNELHILLYFSTYKLWVNILWYVKNIFCFFRLIIYVLYSFTHTFSTFYKGSFFSHTLVRCESFPLCFSRCQMWCSNNILVSLIAPIMVDPFKDSADGDLKLHSPMAFEFSPHVLDK